MFTDFDFFAMRRALSLAQQGLYTTSPNPRVGCVITRDAVILGEGYTQPAGQHHAEIQAINDALSKGHSLVGATAYVTLEPCSHFGRTPPCADALIKFQFHKVIIAMQDPNPLVAGQGMARLKQAGIDVQSGLLSEQARVLNSGFIKRMTVNIPWFRIKIAASLDGVTALSNGNSQWITGEIARADGHHWRARSCAILTGIGTVLADDPVLNVRAVETTRQPACVVLDSHLRIPLNARILQNRRTVVVTASRAIEKEAQLKDKGVEVLHLPSDHEKRIDLQALAKILNERAYNEIHVEAGATLNAALIEAGLADELLLYLAPVLLGTGRGMACLPLLDSLMDKKQLSIQSHSMVGSDIRILAHFER